jgi:hypothetical protein
MKTAKRVLAILLAMLMAVSAFAVAASAAESIASQLASGNTASISQNTRESVIIEKDATIDLGGKILKSVPGSPAITVKNGATVTIKNGYVESYYNNYVGVSPELLDGIVHTAPSAIVATGAGTTVILEDVRAMGGMVRIPKTKEWFVPTGSALQLSGGAKGILNSAVLIGRYGVNNDPAGTGRADGKVEINDAILFGYLDYVKRVYNGLVYDAAAVEKVNAKDRVVGYLNDNITLTAGEKDLLDKALDDRIYIFTKKPVDDQAIVTINRNTEQATITASTVEYLTREDGEHKNTDCCYKYVPFSAYDAATGETFDLDTPIAAAAVEGKDIRIHYRLEFELKGDFKKLANNFDYYFNKYYPKAIEKIDASYDEIVTKYDQYFKKFEDLYRELDKAGAIGVEIDGRVYSLSNEMKDTFYAIERALLSIGGVTLYKAATGNDMTTQQFSSNDPLFNYGAAVPAAGTYDANEFLYTDTKPVPDGQGGYTFKDVDVYKVTRLGPLDRVAPVLDAFKAIKGNSSLGDQTKWNAYAHLILDNYHSVLKVFEEAETALRKIDTLLKTEPYKSLVQKVKDASSTLSLLDGLADSARDAKVAVDTALDHPIVKSVLEKIDANANNGTVEQYMAKVKRAINDYRTYFTPEDFLADDGAFGLAYTVNGPTEEVIIEKAKLHVKAFGGVVNFVSDTIGAVPAKTEQWTDVPYAQTVTMNAVADAGNEFMYYLDAYTDRILSTNPTMVVDTQAERYITAVFESTNNALVTLTNHSGVLVDSVPYSADGTDVSGVDVPTIKGYDVNGWGPKGATTLASTDFTSAYRSGSSAFENGANYNINGYAFKLNATTANKYLVTPKYTAASKFTITFVDGNTVWSKVVDINTNVTYTASGANFSYWMNDKEQIVSVYRTYSANAIEEATFTAVYDADVAETGYANIVSVIEEDVRYRVYGERSIPAGRKVLSNGFISSYDPAIQEPVITDVNNDTVKASYSTSTSNQGVVGKGYLKTTVAANPNGIYVRYFVELATATGSEFIYSDVYPVVG